MEICIIFDRGLCISHSGIRGSFKQVTLVSFQSNAKNMDRGSKSKIVFDLDSELGESTCVSCGECVQVCPTGALMESNLLNKSNVGEHYPDRSVDTLCPFCGVGCQINLKVGNIITF